jgi:hypothetical protein
MAAPRLPEKRLLLDQVLHQIGQFAEQAKLAGKDAPSTVDSLVAEVTGYLRESLKPFLKSEMLTIAEVAVLLNCSYGEARNKMLTGKLRTAKEGRWIRTRRRWVEKYIRSRIIRPKQKVQAVPKVRRKSHPAEVKAGGVAERFMKNRPR